MFISNFIFLFPENLELKFDSAPSWNLVETPYLGGSSILSLPVDRRLHLVDRRLHLVDTSSVNKTEFKDLQMLKSTKG